MIGMQDAFDYFQLERGHASARLEEEGIVMRCGLTPTDVMHIKGDFDQFDSRASLLAVKYLADLLPMYDEGLGAVQPICDEVYNQVKRKLYTNISRVLIEYAHPDQFGDGLPKQLEQAIGAEWDAYRATKGRSSLRLKFTMDVPLVGVGAPVHIFLPDVAKALGTTCIIPPHAQVANAVGAAIASVSAQAQARIVAEWGSGGIEGYSVHADAHREDFETFEEALAAARKLACAKADSLARERGAAGELTMAVDVKDDRSIANGQMLYFGSVITATAQMD